MMRSSRGGDAASEVLVRSRVELLGPKTKRSLLFSRWKEYMGIVDGFGVTFAAHAKKLSGEKMVPQHLLSKVYYPRGVVYGRSHVIEIHTVDNRIHVIALGSKDILRTWGNALEEIMLCKASLRSSMINEDDLNFGEDAAQGRGATGVVRRAEYHGTPVAVKHLHPVVDAKDAIREIEILCEVNHPYCVTFVGYYKCQKQGAYALVTEFVAYGDLAHLIENQEESPVSLKMKLMYLRDIAIGMSYLHRMNIAHRDLKPANILITTKSDDAKAATIKITDFGEAKAFAPGDDQHTLARGTPLFMAPEIFQRPDYCPLRADVYSFGKLMFQLLSGEWPPEEDLPPVSLPSSIQEQANHIIQKCTSKDPSERIPFTTLTNTLGSLIEKCVSSAPPRGVLLQASTLTDLSQAVDMVAKKQDSRGVLNRSISNPSNLSQSHGAEIESDQPVNYLHELVVMEGGANQSLSWELFVQRACEIMDSNPEDFEIIKPIFFAGQRSQDQVTVSCVSRLTAWFGIVLPEVENPAYFCTDELHDFNISRPEGSYTISDVCRFLKQKYVYLNLERPEAEKLLESKPPGTYLIRVRTKAPGELVLSLKSADGKVQHCIIKRQANEYEMLGKRFTDVGALVTHHRLYPVVGFHPRTKQKLFEVTLTTYPE